MAISSIEARSSISCLTPAQPAKSSAIGKKEFSLNLEVALAESETKDKSEFSVEKTWDTSKSWAENHEEMVSKSPVWSKYYEKIGGTSYIELDNGHKIPAIPFTGDSAYGNIHLDDVESRIDVGMDIFQDQFNRWMVTNDTSSNPPIELKTDSNGKVTVAGHHPQKEKIEAYFEENNDMANFFKGMTAAKSFVELGKETSKFHAEYKVDANAALAKYSHFFSGKFFYETSIHISDEGYSMDSAAKWTLA